MVSKFVNLFADIPFNRSDNPITLFNTVESFSNLLGLSRTAVSIMTIPELKSNLDKYTYSGIYGIYCMVSACPGLQSGAGLPAKPGR